MLTIKRGRERTAAVKMFLANLGINLVTLGCVGIAAYLIMNDKEGWGWFLFLAFCCAGTYTLRKGE